MPRGSARGGVHSSTGRGHEQWVHLHGSMGAVCCTEDPECAVFITRAAPRPRAAYSRE